MYPLCHPQLQSLLAIPHTKGLSPVSTLFYTEDVGGRYVLNIDSTAHTHTVQSLNGGNKSFRLFVTYLLQPLYHLYVHLMVIIIPTIWGVKFWTGFNLTVSTN